MPALLPYDRELVFETAAQTARRYGRVRLAIDRSEWVVTSVANGTAGECSFCGRAVEHVAYHGSGHLACAACARRSALPRRSFGRGLRAAPPVAPAA